MLELTEKECSVESIITREVGERPLRNCGSWEHIAGFAVPHKNANLGVPCMSVFVAVVNGMKQKQVRTYIQ